MLDTREVQAPTKIAHDFDIEADSTEESVTVIPTLPYGKKLKFNVLETWGDMNYLGLTGIEVFDELGMPIEIFDN